MATVKKGTLCRPSEWWVHMKHEKRVMAHLERQAAKRDISSRLNDISEDKADRDCRMMGECEEHGE